MIHETWVRATLWLTAPFNFVAAHIFSFPSSGLGQFVEVPPQEPGFYTLFSGLMVGLFGVAYLWNALQPRIVKPLLAFGAFGKLIAFTLSAVLFGQGTFSGFALVLMAGDLILAVFWIVWLWTDRGEQAL